MKPTRPLICALGIVMLVAWTAGTTVIAEEGFRSVTGPCRLNFPDDHGAHPGYRTEWWYYTGNLTDGDRRFGFQLTFFRSALEPPENRDRWPEPASAWRTDQLFLAHAAIADVSDGRHLQAERMARPVLSMAGAELANGIVTVRLHSWQAVIAPAGHHLEADAEDFSLNLDLTPAKPPIVHGDDGHSRKGQSPERASCYYSFTRLEAAGRLTVAGRRHAVKGLAWMDHEFSTAPLQPGITGWDWFSLQLSDDSEVMIFLLRQGDGALNPASSGTVVSPSGQTRHLRREEVHIEPLAYWNSPRSGARYPVRWQVTIVPLALQLTVAANLEDQEMHTPRSTGVTYWEGSVQATGSRRDDAISGAGYVELTGYAEPFDAPM